MYVMAYTLEKISFSFTGPKGCIPIEKMRETYHAVRLEPHLIPTTAEAVRVYEERGGRLNTDPSIGYDPIACYDHLQESREHLFFLKTLLLQAYFVMLFTTGLTHLLLRLKVSLK